MKRAFFENLKENLWIGVPSTKNGKAVVGEDANPKLVKQRGHHASINQILDSTMKEIEPLGLEVANKHQNKPVDREKLMEKIINFLTNALARRARELGLEQPTKEEKAMMILELVEEPEDKK